jgi:hypothetical protein
MDYTANSDSIIKEDTFCALTEPWLGQPGSWPLLAMGNFWIVKQFSPISRGISCRWIKELGWALWIWWLWLQKTEPNRPWPTLPIQVPDKAKALFSVAMQTEVGDGKNTLFWTFRWLHGQRIDDIALRLFATIPKRSNGRTAHDLRRESGSLISKEPWRLESSRNSCTCGTSYSPLSCKRGWMTTTFGDLQQTGSTQQRWRMRVFSWDQ